MSHSADSEPYASPGLSECERRNPKPPQALNQRLLKVEPGNSFGDLGAPVITRSEDRILFRSGVRLDVRSLS